MQAYRAAYPTFAAFVSLPHNGWVTLLSELFADFSEVVLHGVAATLCRQCNCKSVGLAVITSDLFFCWVFGEDGEMLMRRSAPPELTEQCGSLDELASLARLPSELCDLERIFETDYVYADERLHTLAYILGIEHPDLSYEILLEEYKEICGEEPSGKNNASSCEPAFLHVTRQAAV